MRALLAEMTQLVRGFNEMTANVQGFVSAYASPGEANWVTAFYAKPSKVAQGSTVTMRGMMGGATMAHSFGIKLIAAPVGP